MPKTNQDRASFYSLHIICLIIYNIACKKSINYFIFLIDTLISEFINEHHTNDRSDNLDKQQYPDIEISSENMNLIQVEGRVVWRGGSL